VALPIAAVAELLTLPLKDGVADTDGADAVAWVEALADEQLLLDGEAALLFGAAADGSLRCWRTVDGSLLALQPRAHSGRVEALALRPGPAALYAGSLDGTVRAWALAAAPEEGAADRGGEAGLTAAHIEQMTMTTK
jgi:hypothetical protein